MVKYLHINGANINIRNDCALQRAAENGHLEVVKYLHINGANINANNNNALLLSSKYGRLKIVKYLLQNGADINDCFIKTDEVIILINHNTIIKLKREIRTELWIFNNRIIRTKFAITKNDFIN